MSAKIGKPEVREPWIRAYRVLDFFLNILALIVIMAIIGLIVRMILTYGCKSL